MYNRSEIVQITTSLSGGPDFPIRSTCEMVLGRFKYLDNAKSALKGLVTNAKPGTRLAIRYWYTDTDSYLTDDTTVAEVPEFDLIDPFDGVPADTGTV